MVKRGLVALLVTFLLMAVVSARCACTSIGGTCMDSTFTNDKGDSIEWCCNPTTTYGSIDFNGISYRKGYYTIDSDSDGKADVCAASTGALSSCSGRNGQTCDASPYNGFSGSGKCDSSEAQCVKCDGRKEEKIYTANSAGSGSSSGGDGLCESGCGAPAICDEVAPGTEFADVDNTVDRCTSSCTFEDTNTCRSGGNGFNADAECNNVEIGSPCTKDCGAYVGAWCSGTCACVCLSSCTYDFDCAGGYMCRDSACVANNIPAVPALTDEPDSHSTTVTLEWGAVIDGDGDDVTYDVRVGTSAGGTDILDEIDKETTSQLVSGLSYGVTYHWSVRACDEWDCSEWGSDNFTVYNNPPSVGAASFDQSNFEYGDTLNCSAQVTDADADALTVTYSIWDDENNKSSPNYAGTATKEGDTYYVAMALEGSRGEWSCVISASDGIASAVESPEGGATMDDTDVTGSLDAIVSPVETYTLSASASDINPEDTVYYTFSIGRGAGSYSELCSESTSPTCFWTLNFTSAICPDEATDCKIKVDISSDGDGKDTVVSDEQTGIAVDYDSPPEWSNATHTAGPIYNDMDVWVNVTWQDDGSLTDVRVEHNADGLDDYPAQNSGGLYYYMIANSLLENQETVSWRYFATDDGGHTEYSDWLNFTVQNRAPGVPVLVPETDIYNTYTNLDWNTASDPDGDGVDYNLRVGTTDEGSDLYDETGLDQTDYDIAGLPWGDTIFWAVQACDAYECGSWSASDDFEVIDSNAPFIGNLSKSPSNVYTTTTITFQAYVSDNDEVSEVLFEENETDSNHTGSGEPTFEYEFAGPHPNREVIRWRVHARDPSGNWASSGWQEFPVQNRAPGVPTLAPEPDGTSSPVTLAWGSIVDPDGEGVLYDFRIGTSPESWDYGSDNGTINTSKEIAVVPGTYYWSARACDNTDCSDWADDDVFTITDESAPSYSTHVQSITAPLSGESVTLSAEWDDDFGLDYYWLQSNETGSMTNSSFASLTQWSNVSFDTTGHAGKDIVWRLWANDTSGNAAATPEAVMAVDYFNLTLVGPEAVKPGTNFTVDVKLKNMRSSAIEDILLSINEGSFTFYEGLYPKSKVTLDDHTGNSFGYSVAMAGDVNGDGYDDVIVGDPTTGYGEAYIYFGSANGLSESSNLTLDLEEFDFGKVVSGAGDVNGDGYADVIVSSDTAEKAWVYYGGNPMNAAVDVNLTDHTGNSFGYSSSAAGDVNNDTFDDVIIGDPTVGYGEVYIYFGSFSGLSSTSGLTLDLEEFDFGKVVSGAGDVNGDGYADVIVSSDTAEKAWVYYGGNPMNAAVDVNLTDHTGNSFGYSASGSFDVNGDTYSDVIVGDPTAGFGEAYLYFGSSGGLSSTSNLTLNLEEFDFGLKVSTAGDVNGDNFDDIIVGSSSADKAWVYYGGSSMDNTVDVNLTDHASGDFGYSVSGGGDVNGDGVDDVIVGEPVDDEAYVYYGASATPEPRVVNLAANEEAIRSFFFVAPGSETDYDLTADISTSFGTPNLWNYTDSETKNIEVSQSAPAGFIDFGSDILQRARILERSGSENKGAALGMMIATLLLALLV